MFFFISAKLTEMRRAFSRTTDSRSVFISDSIFLQWIEKMRSENILIGNWFSINFLLFPMEFMRTYCPNYSCQKTNQRHLKWICNCPKIFWTVVLSLFSCSTYSIFVVNDLLHSCNLYSHPDSPKNNRLKI